MSAIPHGTRSGYKYHLCRCADCCQAHRDYDNHRARQQAYGRWHPWGDADAVREHIRRLRSRGWTQTGIARAANVSEDILRRLASNPDRRVKADVAARLLATGNGMPPGNLAADGSTRRLRALAALGHGLSGVAEASGVAATALSAIRDGRRRWVRAGTAVRIRRAYDQLSLTVPTSGGPVRKAAERLGWLPPLAWDDDLIDLPDELLDAELRRRASLMSDAEVGRCPWVHRKGDRSPLIVAGAQEYQRRRKAKEMARRGVAA